MRGQHAEVVDEQRTERTRRSYDRSARCYDALEIVAEFRYRAWRRRLWSDVRGPELLEVGVGTGKNMPFYPPDVRIRAIDLSPKMLERARRRAAKLSATVELSLADVQALPFPDDEFDEVLATFVFCSVPDPVLGLREVRRVLKPGGRLLLLEHVRAANRFVGRLMDIANPLSVRVTGVNINRRTVANVERAGFTLDRVEDIGMRGMFKLLIARNGTAEPSDG